MAARPDPRRLEKPISFGTTQDRKMFPYHFAPDRLGVEMLGVRGSPGLGPGSYLGPQSEALQSWESRRPLSSRGYAMGARTAPRFPRQAQTETPGPAHYRPLPGRPRGAAPAPFGSSSARFPSRPQDRDLFPGPGTYSPEPPLPRGSAWPGRFGAPDWAALPARPRTMVRERVQKMTVDKKFQKNQGREAYLKFYYG